MMEVASLDIAVKLFKCQLLQQRIKGVKIIVDAVNSVRVRLHAVVSRVVLRLECPLTPARGVHHVLWRCWVSLCCRNVQYRVNTSGLRPDDVRAWMQEHDILGHLFERRTTHNELLKRSGDVLRFSTSVGLLTLAHLDLVWEASQGAGDETRGIVLKVRLVAPPDVSRHVASCRVV